MLVQKFAVFVSKTGTYSSYKYMKMTFSCIRIQSHLCSVSGPMGLGDDLKGLGITLELSVTCMKMQSHLCSVSVYLV